MNKFRDSEHLLRLAAVFAAGLTLFLLARGALVPQSFGQYGHFRGDALTEISARPFAYAGHKICEDCHSELVQTKQSGKHAGVNCEACHGPLAKHAASPMDVVPQPPDTAVLCARCHAALLAKPPGFPQVDPQQHSSGQPCETCHQPHSPLRMPEEKKS